MSSAVVFSAEPGKAKWPDVRTGQSTVLFYLFFFKANRLTITMSCFLLSFEHT